MGKMCNFSMWFLLFSVEEEKPTVETGKRKGDTDDWRREMKA